MTPEQTAQPIGDLPDPRAGHPDRARAQTAPPAPIPGLSAFDTPRLERLVDEAARILRGRREQRDVLDVGTTAGLLARADAVRAAGGRVELSLTYRHGDRIESRTTPMSAEAALDEALIDHVLAELAAGAKAALAGEEERDDAPA